MSDYQSLVHTAHLVFWTRFSIGFGILCAAIIFLRSGDSGDDLWIWIPFFILLPFIALPVYLVYRWKRWKDDKDWDREQVRADKNRGKYVSRHVSSEDELRRRYYEGKGRRK